MNDNMNRPDERSPENIGGYVVKGKINYLGPIVGTDAQMSPDGTRVTNFESTEISALPPELTAHQTNRLALGVVAGVLEEFILPELRQRSGQAISLHQVMSSPELVRKALVIIPPQGAPIVHLNEEADEAEIPPYYAWVRLEREGYTWRLQADWLPQFPEPVIERVHVAVAQFAEAIIKGDEEKASSLARLSFPGIWGDSSRPLREEMHKEIYVLLYGIGQSNLKDQSPGSDPLESVAAQFPQAVKALRRDYTLEVITAEAKERGRMSDIRFRDSLVKMEMLFRRARLSDRELGVVRLEVALAHRNERWLNEDKEKYLNIRPGTFRAALHRARMKLLEVSGSHSGPYRKLFEAIYGRPARDIR